MSQKRKILALRVTARNSRHLRSGRIDSGLLAEQLVGNLLIADPDMHLSADGVSEDTIVVVTKLPHRKPWAIWIHIVNAANVGDGASRAGHQLQSRAFGRLIVDEEVVIQTHREDEGENRSSDEPLVGEEGVLEFLRFEESVGGNVMGSHIGINLGHDDRRRDRRRHSCCSWSTETAGKK